jgi:CxxC motif-containing protein (DUF1111 family)
MHRVAVTAFVDSLGGHEHEPDGLLAHAPIPDAGETGGPDRPLSAPDANRFERGRALFDHDFGLAEGVGPRFNGDGCRSCHFDPVIGGAGPSDVDVLRYADGPDAGLVAHRHHTDGHRPGDGDVDRFERRQTPTTLGLGLIDAIPDEAILAHADPDDRDGDGIRGRASILGDGRLGRFGWKAQVPSLADFARDALGTELGVTTPGDTTMFGKATDDDDAPDPEISPDELDDLIFFMRHLAPPRADDRSSDAVALGEVIFERIACGRCHVPTLPTSDGRRAALYSDLLLHEVGPRGSGPLRTPPLWGVARTAPYLHDGSAATLADAIERHGAEAEASSARFAELSPRERDALIAFLRSR